MKPLVDTTEPLVKPARPLVKTLGLATTELTEVQRDIEEIVAEVGRYFGGDESRGGEPLRGSER